MKTLIALIGVLFATAFAHTQAGEKLSTPRVLYVGHRASDFTPLLKQYFTKVESIALGDFKPVQAEEFDVVVLDWPQNGARPIPNTWNSIRSI